MPLLNSIHGSSYVDNPHHSFRRAMTWYLIFPHIVVLAGFFYYLAWEPNCFVALGWQTQTLLQGNTKKRSNRKRLQWCTALMCCFVIRHVSSSSHTFFMQQIYGMLSLALHGMSPPSDKWQEIGSMLWICSPQLNGKHCWVQTSCPSLSNDSCHPFRFPKQLSNWR